MCITVKISGQDVLIDREHLGLVQSRAWAVYSVRRQKYVRWHTKVNNQCVQYKLHRVIAGAKAGDIVDHINGDTLDNRASNLRIVSSRQNNLNMAKTNQNVKKTSSRFKGVSLNKGKWRASIRTEAGPLYLGRFDDEVAAAYAYDLGSLKHHGEYGRTNFLPLA